MDFYRVVTTTVPITEVDLYRVVTVTVPTTEAVIFLPARPASQTHDSHKGRMISNHVNPAGRIKNCGEKAAFNIFNFRFECFFTCAPCLE